MSRRDSTEFRANLRLQYITKKTVRVSGRHNRCLGTTKVTFLTVRNYYSPKCTCHSQTRIRFSTNGQSPKGLAVHWHSANSFRLLAFALIQHKWAEPKGLEVHRHAANSFILPSPCVSTYEKFAMIQHKWTEFQRVNSASPLGQHF